MDGEGFPRRRRGRTGPKVRHERCKFPVQSHGVEGCDAAPAEDSACLQRSSTTHSQRERGRPGFEAQLRDGALGAPSAFSVQ